MGTKREAADFGALDPTGRRAALFNKAVTDKREALLRVLYGRNVKRTRTLEEIIYNAMIAFGENRVLRVRDYVELCQAFATAPTVRFEVGNAERAGLFVLERDVSHARSSPLVRPTNALIRFYNVEGPRFMGFIEDLVNDSEDDDRRDAFADRMPTSYTQKL